MTRDHLMPMPIEIQCRIFNYFMLHERIRLCLVSKSWRTMILNAPGTWKTDTDLIDLLVYLRCNKLNNVIMTFGCLTRLNAFNFISMYDPTLTRAVIVIDWIQQHKNTKANVAPDFILRHCRNLEHFTFVGEIEKPVRYQPSKLLTNVKLQHLAYLALGIENMDGCFDLLAFLKSTPKLEYLGIALRNILGICDSLSEQLLQPCPRLKVLYMPGDAHNHYEIPHVYKTQSMKDNNSSSEQTTGVAGIISTTLFEMMM
ncbi:hypothetical protein BDA99DRAFT_558332 [Phascolomyces articulosus]|uniref:F-box domain-containing protein n=1 Tax=Phascolomyces articulosus TaxID=60185 RepID=A0AAD5PG20_9FUNG|nr:hypothetical protein BDA99DRAFT_558332 [Phascolomyces articulosus]